MADGHPAHRGRRGATCTPLSLVADEMRRRQAGDVVTYVVNRNINFTNVCIKHCTFCAFSRDHREEEGYFLPMDEVVRRAIEAWEMGATEVCIQAGLPPKLDGSYYVDLCRAIKAARARDAPARVLARGDPVRLDALGPGRSPTTCASSRRPASARCPAPRPRSSTRRSATSSPRGRITVEQWIEVITSAHAPGHPHHLHDHVRPRRAPRALGAPHGPAARHPEPDRRLHRVRAALADPPGGADVPPRAGARRAPGATGLEVDQDARARAADPRARASATSRPPGSRRGRSSRSTSSPAGANDLGGTLINESISTSAGARLRPARAAGRAAPARSATPGASPRSATPSTTCSRSTRTGTTTRTRRSTTSTTRRRASAPTGGSPGRAQFPLRAPAGGRRRQLSARVSTLGLIRDACLNPDPPQ